MRRNSILLVVLLMVGVSVSAQKQDTIFMDINTTIHLLFESNVIKADVGSGQYVDESGNVVSDISTEYTDVRLKLAPNIEYFHPTNMFVETEKGYYSFILFYKSGPKQFVYPISLSRSISQKRVVVDDTGVNTSVVPVTTSGAGTAASTSFSNPISSPSKTKKKASLSVPETSVLITDSADDVIAGKASQKVNFWVDGIFVDNVQNKIFFRMNVKNDGNIVYDWGYTGFFKRNKGNKSLKNEAIQEEEISPFYIHNDAVNNVEGKQHVKKIYVFDKFTLAEKKILSIEFWENDGDRKVIIELTAKDLLKARVAPKG